MPVVSSRGPPGPDHRDSIRVKVKDSRRKQQWVDPLPTPPRSPTTDLDSEPIMDDLWELWTGAGLHELAASQDFTLDSALNDLGFTDEDFKTCHSSSNSDDDCEMDFSINSIPPFPPGDMIHDADDEEELLNQLFHFVQDNSPPSTNPPSPPRDNEDSETEPFDGFHNSCSSNGGSSNSSTNGDGDSCPSYDDNFLSSGENSPLYDEGLIGEDLINEQPDLFDSPFGLIDSKLNIFDEDFGKEIKHDCMWGFTNKDTEDEHVSKAQVKSEPEDVKFDYTKVPIKIEPVDSPVRIKKEIMSAEDDEEMAWSCNDPYTMWPEETPSGSQSPCSTTSREDNGDNVKGLDWTEVIEDAVEDIEFIRSATINDHSYANPIVHETKFTRDMLSRRSNAIQGIVIKEENGDDYSGGPRKTKILVPLKDLMDSLQHKTFLVAPLGPGKKVIRLTGSETVKGMLGVHHYNTASFKSVSSLCVPQSSLYSRSHLPSPSNQHRAKRAKSNKSIIREGGTITFPQQSPTPTSSSLSSLSGSSSSSGSSSTTASGRPKKTKTHNNMERMRRIDLRNSFDSLKKLVPPLSKSTKCSKVEILRRAEEYIRALKSLEKRLLREEATVRSRNDALKLKVLHSQCA